MRWAFSLPPSVVRTTETPSHSFVLRGRPGWFVGRSLRHRGFAHSGILASALRASLDCNAASLNPASPSLCMSGEWRVASGNVRALKPAGAGFDSRRAGGLLGCVAYPVSRGLRRAAQAAGVTRLRVKGLLVSRCESP